MVDYKGQVSVERPHDPLISVQKGADRHEPRPEYLHGVGHRGNLDPTGSFLRKSNYAYFFLARHGEWADYRRDQPPDSARNVGVGLLRDNIVIGWKEDHETEGVRQSLIEEDIKKRLLREVVLSENQEEVLAILERAGLLRQVESFHQHLSDRNDYVRESDHPGARLESLKAASRFLINYDPPYSDIEADLEGNVEMEWLLSSKPVKPDIDHDFWGNGSGYMAIRFVSSRAIEFAMLSGPWAENKERLKVSGTFSHSKMHSIIKMFRDRVVLYD